MSEIQRIKGGFSKVPDHLKTKTQLNKMGLNPVGEPVAEVWSSHQWCKLYDIKDTKEKKKPTLKQLAVLEKARQTKEENEIRRYEEEKEREREFQREFQREFGMNTFGDWYHRDFVILDTETTSLDGEIIDIAIIDRHGNTLFNSLVKPKGEISKEAYYVHGISNETVSDAPTWPEVFPRIAEILKDKLILIYNEEFDVSMIHNSCTSWGLKPINLETECVMRCFASYYGYKRWVSLEDASGDYVSHRALEDCFSTLKVVKEIWEEIELIPTTMFSPK